MIAGKTNFDDNFWRSCLIAFMRQFRNQVRWTNHYSEKNVEVIVPIYHSLTGDPRFLFDAFVDDPVQCRLELDTPKVPSMVVVEKGVNYDVSEQTNPNVKAQMIIEDDDDEAQLKRVYSTLKAVPITISYQIDYYVDTEIDLWKFRSAFLEIFYRYRFFTFSYNYIKIDAFFLMPESFENPINRDFSFSEANTTISTSFNIDIKTYYPIFDTKRHNTSYATKTDDTTWGQFSERQNPSSGPKVATWEDSNEITTSSKVANWIYSIANENEVTLAEGAVPDMEEEAYNKARILMQGLKPTLANPNPQDIIDIDQENTTEENDNEEPII